MYAFILAMSKLTAALLAAFVATTTWDIVSTHHDNTGNCYEQNPGAFGEQAAAVGIVFVFKPHAREGAFDAGLALASIGHGLAAEHNQQIFNVCHPTGPQGPPVPR